MAEKQTKTVSAGTPQPANLSELSGGEIGTQGTGGSEGSTGNSGGTEGAAGDQDKNKNAGQTGDQTGGKEGGQAAGTTGQEGLTEDQKKAAAAAAKSNPLTDEQVQAYLKEKGIDVTNFDELKTKLSTTPAKEKTPEEKEADAKAFENRVLQTYLSKGGKVEDYVALKQIVEADLKEFSVKQLRQELLDNKFTEAEANEIIAERYYQYSDEDIESLSDDDQKRIAKAKREYGSKKLDSRSVYLKEKAQGALKDLHDEVKALALLEQKENEFSSKVDESLTKVPRKITFQLGENDGQAIDPIDYDVAEEDIVEIASILKDPEKRNKFFYTEGNSLNIENIAQVMLRNKILESALKSSYLEGGNRQVKKFETIFPHHANDLGVGGQKNGTGKTGKLASFGQPTIANPQQNR